MTLKKLKTAHWLVFILILLGLNFIRGGASHPIGAAIVGIGLLHLAVLIYYKEFPPKPGEIVAPEDEGT